MFLQWTLLLFVDPSPRLVVSLVLTDDDNLLLRVASAGSAAKLEIRIEDVLIELLATGALRQLVLCGDINGGLLAALVAGDGDVGVLEVGGVPELVVVHVAAAVDEHAHADEGVVAAVLAEDAGGVAVTPHASVAPHRPLLDALDEHALLRQNRQADLHKHVLHREVTGEAGHVHLHVFSLLPAFRAHVLLLHHLQVLCCDPPSIHGRNPKQGSGRRRLGRRR